MKVYSTKTNKKIAPKMISSDEHYVIRKEIIKSSIDDAKIYLNKG